MAVATPEKQQAPEAPGTSMKPTTFISPRIKNTRVVLKPKRVRRSDKGDILGEEPGIAVSFHNHYVTIDDGWVDRHADGLQYYDDVDGPDWVLNKMRTHELWHQRDGWHEKGFPPGAKLPLPSQLIPQITAAAAAGDVSQLKSIRDEEQNTHAREQILDQVNVALQALAKGADTSVEGGKSIG